MTLYEQIVGFYPELLESPEIFSEGIIFLRNDSDGQGDYIHAWGFDKPIPKGLKLGK